jgi:hypothetical protein
LFLIKSSFLATSFGVSSRFAELFGMGGGGAPFLVIFKTQFPRKMTEAEYTAAKADYIDESGVQGQFREFKNQGRIIDSETIFSSVQSQWIVLFKNRATYYDWCYQVVGRGFFDEARQFQAGFKNRNIGFHIVEPIDSQPLRHLLAQQSGKAPVLLHQNQKRSDHHAFGQHSLS